MRRPRSRLRLSSEEGQTVPIVAVMLLVLMLAVALTIDPSNAFVNKQQLQNTADAIALGASGDLGTAAGITTGAPCTGQAAFSDACIKPMVNKWASLNGWTSTLVNCSSTNPVNTPPCYTWPYQGDGDSSPNPNKIEIRLVQSVTNFFGGLYGLLTTAVHARAVGVVGGNGTPPPFSFVSVNSSCDNHTLLIKLGGKLTVENAVYVDSGNGSSAQGCGNNAHGDAFDIFGTGGQLIDPKQIYVHGGWETHDGSTVSVAGVTCPLSFAGASTPQTAGCPLVGQALLPDPFAGLTPPALDPGGVPNNNCSLANPCYAETEFSPPYLLDGGIGISSTSAVAAAATGGAGPANIANNSYIGIGGERIKVGTVGGAPAGVSGHTLSNLTRGALGSVATAHSETSLTVTAVRSVSNTVTLTTSTPHDLSIGDWVSVDLTSPNNNYNGVFQVTDIPDDEVNASPVQFSYVIPGGAKPDIGQGTIVAARRKNGEATITVAAAPSTPFAVGDAVVIDCSDTSFSETLDDKVTIDSVSNGGKSFSYAQPGLPDVAGSPVGIKTYQRFEGTATIVTTAAPTVVSGLNATISNPDDMSFNADTQPTFTNATTFTYANSGPEAPPDKLQNNVTKWQRTGGVTTLTAGTGGLSVGAFVIVHLNGAADTSFNGKFQVTAVNSPTNGTFQYDQAGNPDVPLTSAPGGSQDTYDTLLPVASYSRNGNVATVTLTAATTFATNNDVIVDLAASSFNGTFNITSVSADKKTITYGNPGPNVGSTSGASGDGVTSHQAAAGTAITGSGSGTVTPDDESATGVAGFASAAGSAIGPLTEILSVNPTPVTSPSSPTSPAEYTVPAGTGTTLNPGTYYGGICLGAPLGAACGTKVGGSCSTSTAKAATVTLNPGIYIMAGGGFFVCGNTTLDASAGVMIYNTQDSLSTTAAGKLDQIEFNTNGTVTLAPQTGGAWNGMAIYQGPDPAGTGSPNPDLELSTSKCDGRQASQTDILFENAGGSQPLNNISGTIYAPAQDALFTDAISGNNANIAVITGCIYIAGADSTFNFNPTGLFGFGGSLGE